MVLCQVGCISQKGPHIVSLWLRLSPRTAVSPDCLCPRASGMIARNAHQAAEDCRGRRRTGAQPASARGYQVPLLDVKLSYTGCVVTPLRQDPVLARLEDVLLEPRNLAPVRVRWRALSMPTEPEEVRDSPPVRARWRALSMPTEARNL